jgi:hypothetical protein
VGLTEKETPSLTQTLSAMLGREGSPAYCQPQCLPLQTSFSPSSGPVRQRLVYQWRNSGLRVTECEAGQACMKQGRTCVRERPVLGYRGQAERGDSQWEDLISIILGSSWRLPRALGSLCLETQSWERQDSPLLGGWLQNGHFPIEHSRASENFGFRC